MIRPSFVIFARAITFFASISVAATLAADTIYMSRNDDNIAIPSNLFETRTYLDFGGRDTYNIPSSLPASITIVDRQESQISFAVGTTISNARFAADGAEFQIDGKILKLLGQPVSFAFDFPDATRTVLEVATLFGAEIPVSGAQPVSGNRRCTIESDGTLGCESTDYQPGAPAPLSTVTETATEEVTDGSQGSLTLSDGTQATIPALESSYALTLARESTDIEELETTLEMTGLSVTGTTRELVVQGLGEPENLKPVVSIPRDEAGSIDLETVNVMRIGTLLVNGELLTDQRRILPASIDNNGDIRFVDPFMIDSLEDTASQLYANSVVDASAASHVAANLGAGEWIGRSRYVLVTFQDDLNWNRSPRLVRMIPDATLSGKGYRRSATEEERAELNKRPICNLIVLVHGHNEEEKEGSYQASAEAPWYFGYKRRVWDLLYKEIQTETDEQPEYPYDCTAFYEFIFPTYRPVFSAFQSKTGRRYETLGESLAKLISDEFKNNPQLNSLEANKMPFHVFMFAHSQGGLVVRAGLQHMSSDFRDRIKRLVTWGTPHHGAALYTLRYALQAGLDMVVDGVRLPLQNIGNSMVIGALVKDQLNEHVALDTPGIRDLRWDASLKDMLNLETLFPALADSNIAAKIEPPLFSDSLAAFNAGTDTLGVPTSFIFGETSKSATLELADVTGGWWWQYRLQQVQRFADSTSIEQGSTLNSLMANGMTNDGAVPLYSQRADGLYGGDRISMGDVDHEEFYGGEPPLRDPATEYLGTLTAQKTLDESDFDHASRTCPVLVANVGRTLNKDSFGDYSGGGKISVTGQLHSSLYESSGAGIGGQIKQIEAREDDIDGDVLDELAFTYDKNGKFSGEAIYDSSASVPEAFIVAILKDESEIAMESITLEIDKAGTGRWSEIVEHTIQSYVPDEEPRVENYIYWYDTSDLTATPVIPTAIKDLYPGPFVFEWSTESREVKLRENGEPFTESVADQVTFSSTGRTSVFSHTWGPNVWSSEGGGIPCLCCSDSPEVNVKMFTLEGQLVSDATQNIEVAYFCAF